MHEAQPTGVTIVGCVLLLIPGTLALILNIVSTLEGCVLIMFYVWWMYKTYEQAIKEKRENDERVAIIHASSQLAALGYDASLAYSE